MNELIKITERDGKQTVSARDLHVFLEVKTRFNDWIKIRLEDTTAEIHSDYTVLEKYQPRNNPTPKKEYFVTIDLAKEIAMLERNDKGKEARRYFIQCEKKLKLITARALPTSFADALRLAADQAEEKFLTYQSECAIFA